MSSLLLASEPVPSQLAPPRATVGPSTGRVLRLRSLQEVERYADAWDALAGDHPFRGRTWSMNWWQTYGQPSTWRRSVELAVLLWIDGENEVLAIAPWYLSRHPLWGRVVAFLGSGEVCGDYLAMLCRPGEEDLAAQRFAEYLLRDRFPAKEADCPGDGSNSRQSTHLQPSRRHRLSWDCLELSGVESAEPTMRALVDYLHGHNCLIDHQPDVNGWQIPLPNTWSDYMAGLSANARRRFRRLSKMYFSDPRLELRRVETPDALQTGFAILEQLHQALWKSRGMPGCFASPRFRQFHWRLAHDLLAQGRLNLVWLEWENRPIVAEYQFLSKTTVYAYQSGMAPDALHLSPGNLGNLICIDRAIREGYQSYDFCRGDEPYKAYLGAKPRPLCRWRVSAPHPLARLRFRLWQFARAVKRTRRKMDRPASVEAETDAPCSPGEPHARE